MRQPGQQQRRDPFESPLRLTLAPLLSVIFCAGCANPGPPKPPSLHLPALVADLTAERTGNRVLLHWTTPASTTDGLAVKGAMTAQICRETGPRPGTSAARLTACAPVLRVAVAPGPSQVADSLPAALRADPVLLLTYRIQIFNSVERSAGDSTIAAFAAAGAAPPPVDSFNGTASEHGATLEWTTQLKSIGNQVELTRTSPSAPAIVEKPAKPAKPLAGGQIIAKTPSSQTPSETHLRSQEPPSGTLDTTAKFGETYIYTAARMRPASIGAHDLEIRSEQSPPITVDMRDTFPPRSPTGLATIAGSGAAATYIDLSWEPNSEPDLAGYFVYRQLARPNGDPQGPLGRLTPTPVTAPAYRDVAVSPSQRYIYWVTAVDASGNESAPSAKAQDVVTPE